MYTTAIQEIHVIFYLQIEQKILFRGIMNPWKKIMFTIYLSICIHGGHDWNMISLRCQLNFLWGIKGTSVPSLIKIYATTLKGKRINLTQISELVAVLVAPLTLKVNNDTAN